MANPNLASAIGVKVALANVGEYVILRNLTRGGKLTQQLAGSDRGTVFNPAPDSEWQDGDTVQGEIRGRLQGVAQKKIQSGTANIRITAVADTTTPGVSL